jgi:DNA helicase TIP49 (TBP-interacting protein)
MAEYSVKIENLDQIRRAFRKAPELMVKHLNTAIEGSIFQVERTVTKKGYSNEYYQNRNLLSDAKLGEYV